MTPDPTIRPRRYPPPEFPPRRPKLFAKTPPAIFPPILGLLGLVLALRAGLAHLGLPPAPADLLAGLIIPLWAFAALAYAMKLARRPTVMAEDLRVMPARAGLAAATMGGMASAGLLAPYAPDAALALLWAALVLHGVVAAMIVRTLLTLPPEARGVNPGWHMIFVGFIVGGLSAALMGQTALAQVLLWAMLGPAVLIWAISLNQLRLGSPPAPLRPMLAIHIAPAALLGSVASVTGPAGLATGLSVLALAILAALLVSLRWITPAGFSPLWAAFTFPLTAAAGALIRQGGLWADLGLGLLGLALIAVPLIAWQVLRRWPGGQLAARTNTAEA